MSILGQDGINTYASVEEELEVLQAGFSMSARTERNRLLTESDWVVVKAQEAGTSIPTEWATYRTALRDITSTEGWPFSHVWPTKP
jgi:hypothetical protein